jgi:uncharacterized protein with GYD domain
MPTYLALLRWTKEGLEKIKESPAPPAWKPAKKPSNLPAES